MADHSWRTKEELIAEVRERVYGHPHWSGVSRVEATALVEHIAELQAQVAAAESFIDKIRELAYMGGQNGEIVRRWILDEFEKAGRRDKP